MAPYKVPGPNGFQALFFQKYWALVGEKVSDMVLSVLRGQALPEGLNETYLALIPKVDNPHLGSQLRPIGLCNVSYKIITKTIAHRLKLVLPSIISPTQTSFVPARQIGDNIIIMQELLHFYEKEERW